MRFLVAALTLDDEGTILKEQWNLSDFNLITRGNIKEIIRFSCKEIVNTVDKNKVSMIYLEKVDNVYCVTVYQKVWYCLIVTEKCSYPIIQMIIDKLKKDQNPFDEYKTKPVDKVTKIQQDVDTTKEIMTNNIENLLRERGTNLEKLVENSEQLSISSKIFIDNSKKLNKRCCNIQ